MKRDFLNLWSVQFELFWHFSIRGRLLLQHCNLTSTTAGATRARATARRLLRCTYSVFAGRPQHSAQNLSSKVAGRSVLALTIDTMLMIAAARTKSTTPF